MGKHKTHKRPTFPHAQTFTLKSVFEVKRLKDRRPLEYAAWLQAAYEKYGTLEATAAALNIGSKFHIASHLRINEMPAEVRKLIDNNVLSPSLAWTVLYEFSNDIRIRLANHAVAHGLGRWRLNRYANMFR